MRSTTPLNIQGQSPLTHDLGNFATGVGATTLICITLTYAIKQTWEDKNRRG